MPDETPAPEAPREVTQRTTRAMTLPLGMLAAGRTVFSRYRLEREIGHGGMGVVWSAHDSQLELPVAMKFLPEAVASDEEAMRELARETRMGLQLSHPGIVRVHTLERDAKFAAIVMELVDGPSLAHRKTHAPGGCLSASELAPLVAQLCDALEFAHSVVKLAHLDLKPGNLLVTSEGRLKITDFGIARSLSDTRTRLTSATGMTSGTLLYMSPQQLRGKSPRASDDIYGLGATLYELLTGKPPFYRGDISFQVLNETPEPMEQHRAQVGASGPPIPPHWEETIRACLAKAPEQRPHSVREIGERLAAGDGMNRGAAGPRGVLDISNDVTRFAPAEALPPAVSAAPPAPPPPAPALPVAAGHGSGHAGERVSPANDEASPPPGPPAKPSASRAGKRPLVWAALAAAVVLFAVGLAWWFGGEKPVTAEAGEAGVLIVTVEPAAAPARLWVGPVSDRAIERGRVEVRELPAGEHDLVVQAMGYEAFHSRVTVPTTAPLRVTLAPLRGSLSVVGRPGSVVTVLDGDSKSTALGAIPANGELTAERVLLVGHYTVRLVHPDCAPAEQAGVEVAVGRTPRVAPPQVALPGELRVFSSPPGATVLVGGQESGNTPATLREVPSERVLAVEARLRGFQPIRRDVTLKPRETRVLNLGTLLAEAGALRLELGSARGDLRAEDFNVRVAGREVSPTSGGSWTFENLPVGTQPVEVRHPDFAAWSGTVELRDGQTTPLRVALEARPGTVVLTTTPAGARLSVRRSGATGGTGAGAAARGDVALGDLITPYRGELPAGDYIVRFVLAGHNAIERPLAVTPNRAAELSVTLTETKGPEMGQPFTVTELDLTLQPIAPGTFAMGSEAGDEDEAPITRVTLTRPFWLGRTEVTQAQWQALMGRNPSRFKGEDRPVEQITWEEAVEFCRKLTASERAAGRLPEDFEYTLPTEAQWEYACRAGTTGDFAGGKLADLGWFDQNSRSQTQPVAQKQANAWGLHDQHGNVWEWCLDWQASYPGGNVTDPRGPAAGNFRVFRGGSWFGSASGCRSASRNANEPKNRFSFVGLRVALVQRR